MTAIRDPLGLIRGAEGVITGTVVCAAVIAYGADHFDSVGQLSLAIFGTAIVYWLAHLHAHTVASSLTHRHHPFAAFRLGLANTWTIAAASILPVIIMLLASLFGASMRASAWTALLATIALLAVYSYLAG